MRPAQKSVRRGSKLKIKIFNRRPRAKDLPSTDKNERIEGTEADGETENSEAGHLAMAKSKSREAQDTAITANPPQRKRCHKGIFVTNSDSSGNESSVSRTKKVKVEGPYGMRAEQAHGGKDANTLDTEGSSCDAKDKEKNDQLKMDMAKALAGVDDPSKGHESPGHDAEYEYCGFLVAPRHSDEEM